MKITKQEVKTFYDIELTAADFVSIIGKYANDTAGHAICPKAFDWFTPKEGLTECEAVAVMKRMFVRANGDTYNYIARALGFDGWYNAGFYVDLKNIYVMVLFNHGDHINKESEEQK